MFWRRNKRFVFYTGEVSLFQYISFEIAFLNEIIFLQNIILETKFKIKFQKILYYIKKKFLIIEINQKKNIIYYV